MSPVSASLCRLSLFIRANNIGREGCMQRYLDEVAAVLPNLQIMQVIDVARNPGPRLWLATSYPAERADLAQV
jgi:hypothetical protein